jgi:hypothetical protein
MKATFSLFFWKEKYLNFAAQIKIIYSLLYETAKNKGNAELRIDGDFYPCTF